MKIEVTSRNYLNLPKGRYSLGGGLILFVSSEDSRSWVVRFTFDGKRVDFSLGSAKYMSITAAKAKAAAVMAEVKKGIDPRESRRAAKAPADGDAVLTFGAFAERAIREIREVRRWKNAKHADQWTMTIETYACPVLGHLPLADIGRGDVLEVLRPIWTDKPETANRVRGRLENIFDHAIAKGLIEHNPATWKGGLASFLPPISKVRAVKHHEAMPLEDLKAFAPQIAGKASIVSQAVLFGILTATRAQEFLGAQWEEIDVDRAVWTIPAERMKCGIEHRVPLSRQALELLVRLDRKAELVFPAPRGGKQMVIDSPRAFIRKSTGKPFTMHGFRSTFRDWCEENFVHEALAERALAHVKGDKVIQAYQRSDLLEQRRPVMQLWADAILPDA